MVATSLASAWAFAALCVGRRLWDAPPRRMSPPASAASTRRAAGGLGSRPVRVSRPGSCVQTAERKRLWRWHAAAIGAAAVGALLGGWMVALMLAVAVSIIGSRRRRAREAERLRRIAFALPEALDLAVLAADAGLTPRELVGLLADWAPDPVRAAFCSVRERCELGERLGGALDVLVEQLGPMAQAMVHALASADSDGTPLAAPLRNLAADARADRRRRAELAARRLTIALLAPLVMCIFPAMAVLTLAPVAAAVLRSLHV